MKPTLQTTRTFGFMKLLKAILQMQPGKLDEPVGQVASVLRSFIFCPFMNWDDKKKNSSQK